MDMVRVLALATVLVAFTATARAQAPGEVAPAAPAAAPQVSCSGGSGPIDVMANRWAVGLSVGSLSVAPKDTPDNKTQFGIGELSLRFRATPHLEIEAAFGGGREQLSDGSQGQAEVHTGLIALRYRFSPEHEWNWWVMGGVGGFSVAPHGSTDQQFQDAQRPMGTFGFGIERRFSHFALQAELRAVGVGQNKDQPKTQPVMGTAQTTTMPPPPASTAAQNLSGGALTIGASYYF